jgi:hypothetical protein
MSGEELGSAETAPVVAVNDDQDELSLLRDLVGEKETPTGGAKGEERDPSSELSSPPDSSKDSDSEEEEEEEEEEKKGGEARQWETKLQACRGGRRGAEERPRMVQSGQEGNRHTDHEESEDYRSVREQTSRRERKRDCGTVLCTQEEREGRDSGRPRRRYFRHAWKTGWSARGCPLYGEEKMGKGGHVSDPEYGRPTSKRSEGGRRGDQWKRGDGGCGRR